MLPDMVIMVSEKLIKPPDMNIMVSVKLKMSLFAVILRGAIGNELIFFLMIVVMGTRMTRMKQINADFL